MPADEQQSFSLSYDPTTKIITAVVFAMVIFVTVVARSAIAAGLGAAVIAISYAYSPLGYAIRDASIIIRRLAGSVRIPLDRIRDARPATADDFKGAIRLWGNGGLFGYYGKFSTSKLGTCTWYMTNRKNAVIVATSGQTFLLSPDDVPSFLAALPQASAAPGQRAATAPRRTMFPIAAWVGAGIGVLVVGILAFAFSYSPGPPRLTLTANALAIHDRSYPVTIGAADVDTGKVTIVDISSDSEWRPTARTNGFANSHYRSGWFRTANGQSVRMYWADASKLVLLPPKGNGAPILLQVSDPPRFIDDLRQEWASQR